MGSSLKYIATKEEFNTIPFVALDAYDYLQSLKNPLYCTRYIFIRHGESTSNAEKSIAGRSQNVDLSPKGREQAIIVGKKLAATKISIHAAYSSPSLRAKKTAALIHIGPHIEDERLLEKFYGPFEGATEEEYRPARELEEHQNCGPHIHFNGKFTYKAHPDMESMREIHERVSHFLFEKHAQHEGHNVLIATHNGVMKALFISAAASLGHDVDYRSFILENASILVIEVGKNEIFIKAASGLIFSK